MSCKYTKRYVIFYKLVRNLYDAGMLQLPEVNAGNRFGDATSLSLRVNATIQQLLQCSLYLSCGERGEYKHNDA